MNFRFANVLKNYQFVLFNFCFEMSVGKWKE